MAEARAVLAGAVARLLVPLHRAVAAMAGSDDRGPLVDAARFLETLAAEYEDVPLADGTPLARLRDTFGLDEHDVDLVLLTGLADEHEGLTTLFRTLHPEGRPRPTVGLAAQVLAQPGRGIGRQELLERVATGPARAAGLLRLEPSEPLPEAGLVAAPALWQALGGGADWPPYVRELRGPVPTAGLDDWLASPPVARIARLLARREAWTVLVTADSPDTAHHRAAVLARPLGMARLEADHPLSAGELQEVGVHAVARGLVPLVLVRTGEQPYDVPDPLHLPVPLVMCVEHGTAAVRGGRPLATLRATPLRARERRRMWSDLLPELQGSAAQLAARHPIEPHSAAMVAADIRRLAAAGGSLNLDAVGGAVRARGAAVPGGGVASVVPRAGWDDLVLPRRQLDTLRAAAGRLRQQAQVLDEWGFLPDRRGVRGVRMLFAGPPGTGKTLAAEVLASELGGVDLLIVDISKIVSKWIGETEKNLARVFDLAENAVLFFDEADALFGRRTEVSDAHDRYANLETAYLLSRLERFEGIAILATNLKANIDPAFLRRMDYVLDFRAPTLEERVALWRAHVPEQTAPVDPGVDFPNLAGRFAVTGGLIRNAAIGAAYLAAAEDAPIGAHHFEAAMRTEYDKAGMAYPANIALVGLDKEDERP